MLSNGLVDDRGVGSEGIGSGDDGGGGDRYRIGGQVEEGSTDSAAYRKRVRAG